jgi:acetoacetyl-CoA synthetase
MAKLLWKPSEEQIKNSNMYRFMNVINEKYHQNFSEFEPLYQWSIENIADFWENFWEFADIIASKPYEQVIDDVPKCRGPDGFPVRDSILPKISCASETIRWP